MYLDISGHRIFNGGQSKCFWFLALHHPTSGIRHQDWTETSRSVCTHYDSWICVSSQPLRYGMWTYTSWYHISKVYQYLHTSNDWLNRLVCAFSTIYVERRLTWSAVKVLACFGKRPVGSRAWAKNMSWSDSRFHVPSDDWTVCHWSHGLWIVRWLLSW